MICYMLECIETCLDEIAEQCSDEWWWERDTVTAANGLRSALRSFVTIVSLIVLYKCMRLLHGFAAKLQRRDLDNFEEYKINSVNEQFSDLRANIDVLWTDMWYPKIKKKHRREGWV